MKISAIEVKGLLAEDFEKKYFFDKFSDEQEKLFFDVKEVPSVVDFAFLGKIENLPASGNVKVEFVHKNERYTLTKTKGTEKVSTVLTKKVSDGKIQQIPYPASKIEQIFECDLEDMLAGYLVDKIEFQEFEKRPSVFRFRMIRDLKQIADDAKRGYDRVVEQAYEAQSGLENISQSELTIATDDDVKEASRAWSSKQSDYLTIMNSIARINDAIAKASGDSEIRQSLDENEGKIAELIKNKDFIDAKRIQISDHKKVQKFVPQLTEVLRYRKQMRETLEKLTREKRDLESLLSEQKGLLAKMEEIEVETDQKIEQRSRLTLIQGEANDIENLKSQNKSLKATLEQLDAEKVELEKTISEQRQAVAELDKIIEDANEALKQIDLPVSSVTELIENIRLGVEIKDLENAIDNLDAQGRLLRDRIVERENDVIKLQEGLGAVVEVDRLVLPFKSRDAIIKMLEARINKNEYIVQSLNNKQKKMREEIQSLTYKELEVDQALESLQTLLASKQFDRDNVIRKQVLQLEHAETQSAKQLAKKKPQAIAIPMSSAFIDEHIESIKGDIFARTNKKMEVVSQRMGLQYALNEVARQREIAIGDIISSRCEKDSIVQKFKELSRIGSNELLQKYFTALNENESTVFMLDLQKILVKAEMQLETAQNEITAIDSQKNTIFFRLSALLDAQERINLEHKSVEMFVEFDEQRKANLMDSTDRLVMFQAQRNQMAAILSDYEARFSEINNDVLEMMQICRVNDKEIEKFTDRFNMYTHGEAEEVTYDAELQLSGLVDEKNVMDEKKAEIEEKIMALRLLIEKHTIELSNLQNDSPSKRLAAQDMLKNLEGETISSIRRKNLSKKDIARFEATVAEYDKALEVLRTKSDEIRLGLVDKVNKGLIADLEAKLETETEKSVVMEKELNELRHKMGDTISVYLASNKQKLDQEKMSNKLTLAENLKSVLKQAKVVEVLFTQKVKKFIKSAAKCFTLLSENRYSIEMRDDIVFVENITRDPVDFGMMEYIDRYMAFVALNATLSAVTNNAQCETMVLCGAIQADVKILLDRLKKLKDKNFVIDSIA